MDDHYLVDYKYTERSFTLSRAVWGKVSTDAHTNGNRTPLLKVIMEGDNDSTLRLWIMDDRQMSGVREDRQVINYIQQNYPNLWREAQENVSL